MSISRRFVLLATAAGIIPAARPSRAAGYAGAVPSPAQRLRRLCRQPASARQIGRRYLALVPQEAGAARLAALILASPGAEAVPGDDRGLRDRLTARVADDFAAGRTVTIEGWILSRTEARYCALCV